MAESDRKKQLYRVAFICRACDHQFRAEPGRVEDAPDDPVHPWIYFATCPECGVEVEQAYWERNLLKAHAKATGPKTAAGMAAVTKNLEGHPTPEEAKRTRFNRLTHARYAQTATYFPARPGRYPECEGCEYRENICPQQVACLKKVELFLQVHAAVDSGDPAALNDINANIQSSYIGLLQDVMRRAIAIGPDLSHQAWYYDKDGGLHWVERVNDETGELEPVIVHEANPLLKILMEMMNKNGLTLEDLALTHKGKEDRDVDMGFIEADKQNKEQIAGYQERSAKALEDLRDMAAKGRQQLEQDPVYLEHKEHG